MNARLVAVPGRPLLVIALLLCTATVHAASGADARPAPGSAGVGRCGSCHPAERAQHANSVHAGEEVRCVSCHGGDDRALDERGAHGAGFRGRITKAMEPQVCASCHSDEARMQAYDLPVDALALYRLSGHGRGLAQGDTQVAVCSDCHGAHEIRRADDPASTVFAANIPRTCGKCHGDEVLMKSRGQANTFALYETSVHAKQLHDRGNLGAPTCVSCHGTHGATPPQVGDIDKVCGRCHSAERRWYQAGPHRRGMLAKGLAECSSCHRAHDVVPAETARLSTQCVDCHAQGSAEARVGVKLDEQYRAAAAAVERADERIAEAEDVPLRTDDYRSRMEVARTYLREALTAGHAVDVEIMATYAERARTVGDQVESEIEEKLGNIRLERILLIVFWFYVLATVHFLRRARDRDPRVTE